MTSRMIQGLALTVGAGALVAAAFTQSAAVQPASTVQAGTPAAHTIKPITFGLIPSGTPKPKATTDSDDADTLYDYINPCSLVPLDAIHKITGNYSLKFDDGKGGMTTNVARAGAIELADPAMPPVCTANPEPGYVKPMLFVGIKTEQSTEDFMALRKQWDDDPYYNAQSADIGGLPSAREAFVPYATVGNTRVYFMLFVHTKYDQTLIVKWSGANRLAMPVLRQLAYEALSTMTGRRYPGK